MFVTTHKIIARTDRHIRSRHRDIGITRYIRPWGIVDLIVSTGCNRKIRDVSFSVVKNGIHIRWEYRLIEIIHLYRRIGPPKKGLGEGSPVKNPALYLQVCFVGIEGKTSHSLCPEHHLDLIDPNGPAAVRKFFYRKVNRAVSTGTMMLRPVEFNAPGDPGAGKANQGRFDHLFIINKIPSGHFIIGTLDTPAQLRQDHDLQIVVFYKHGVVYLLRLFIGDLLDHRVRIDDATAALVDSFFQEHRILLRPADRIGRDRYFFGPCFYFHIYAAFID